MNTKKLFFPLVALFFLGAANLSAGEETNTSGGLTLKGPALAMHGYDAVAFFTEDRATRGSAEYSSVYQNATYRFKSEANRQKFEKQPQKYAPQFGGYCAFGVSVGAKFDGDPEFWKIVDGKLYLNLNGEIQKNWLKDTSGNIDKAQAQWKKIAKVAPSKLK